LRVAKLEVRDLSVLEWLVVGTAATGIVALFLPWYGVEYLGVGAAVTGFSSGFGLLGALLLAAVGVLVLVRRAGVPVPVEVLLGASVLGTVLVAVRCLTIGSVDVGLGTSLSYGPRVGIVIALLAGTIQAGGTVLLVLRSSKETVRTSAGSADEPAAPTPPGVAPPP
jgi:hypothetical protein